MGKTWIPLRCNIYRSKRYKNLKSVVFLGKATARSCKATLRVIGSSMGNQQQQVGKRPLFELAGGTVLVITLEPPPMY
jgi:hypothetical protein